MLRFFGYTPKSAPGSGWLALIAMGKSDNEAHCAVQLSLSHATPEGDIDQTLSALKQVLEEMETTVRFLPCK